MGVSIYEVETPSMIERQLKGEMISSLVRSELFKQRFLFEPIPEDSGMQKQLEDDIATFLRKFLSFGLFVQVTQLKSDEVDFNIITVVNDEQVVYKCNMFNSSKVLFGKLDHPVGGNNNSVG